MDKIDDRGNIIRGGGVGLLEERRRRGREEGEGVEWTGCEFHMIDADGLTPTTTTTTTTTVTSTPPPTTTTTSGTYQQRLRYIPVCSEGMDVSHHHHHGGDGGMMMMVMRGSPQYQSC